MMFFLYKIKFIVLKKRKKKVIYMEMPSWGTVQSPPFLSPQENQVYASEEEKEETRLTAPGSIFKRSSVLRPAFGQMTRQNGKP